HLVVARDNLLRLFEVRRQRRTENLIPSDEEPHSSTGISHSTRLYLIRQQSLYGIVTGLASVKTLATEVDGCDRLLISFKDAKSTGDTLIDANPVSDLPYSPSFVLGYNEIDEHIRNVVDVVFLPGFNTPTVAILFQPGQTWTGRLKETKDNTCLFVVSLDIVTRSYQVIMTVERLPYDSLYLVPCPHYVGGVILVSGNSLIHVDHASKTVILPVSGWAHRITDVPLGPADPFEDISLEGSRAVFIDDITLLIVLETGTVRTLRIQHEGRLVRALALQAPIGILPPPSAVISSHSLVFVASSSAQSVLLQVDIPTPKNPPTDDMEPEQTSGIDLLEIESPVVTSIPAFNEDSQALPSLLPQDSLEDPGVLT
ncbi:10005_t:CDS:2, partial [Acaulospora colombiana]